MAATSAAAATGEEDFPESYFCAITGELMTDPVIDPEGNTYERRAIEEWLALNPTSPVTRSPLSLDMLVPNRALRDAIEATLSGARPPAARPVRAPATPVAAVAAGPVTVNIDVCAQVARNGEADVLLSLLPPPGASRTPVDICCVIDISGSMGNSAAIQNAAGDKEGVGLCLLDIVKHAVKTIIQIMTPLDRVALVSFHTVAKTELVLTRMDAAGKRKAEAALMRLEPDDTTNIWDGLKTGLDLLREGASDSRLQSLVLLTDGKPNVVPPRGHLPMLKKYKDSTPISCSINTFGFGYGLDSQLLTELAVEGEGMYVFIPDPGFVGTAFVNLTSNLLATLSKDVTLAIETQNGSEFLEALGGVPCKKTSWGAELSLAALQYGQTKDVVVRMKLPPGASPYLHATLTFKPHGVFEPCVVEVDGTSRDSSPEVEVHKLRLRAVEVLQRCCFRKLISASRKDIQDLVELIGSSPACRDRRIVELLKDIEGQVTEATSRDDWFARWGTHYLPSLMRAHQLQQCNNFKDPGVQVYGGTLFNQLRDVADDVFVNLPPPVASNREERGAALAAARPPSPPHRHGAPAPAPAAKRRAPPRVSMASYHDAGRVCFDGSCEVLMADGSRKSIRDVKKGDLVMAPNKKQAEVVCVVRTACDTGKALMVTLPGGLIVTPWHPICHAAQWAFPADVLSPAERPCSALYNFVLATEHVMLINGVPCVTFGHAFKGDAREHPFFGSSKVVDQLRRMRGWEAGRVDLPDRCTVRDPLTGLICSLVQ